MLFISWSSPLFRDRHSCVIVLNVAFILAAIYLSITTSLSSVGSENDPFASTAGEWRRFFQVQSRSACFETGVVLCRNTAATIFDFLVSRWETKLMSSAHKVCHHILHHNIVHMSNFTFMFYSLEQHLQEYEHVCWLWAPLVIERHLNLST